MLNRNTLSAITVLALLTPMTAVLADDVAQGNGQSKEHKKLEAEGEMDFSDVAKVIRKITPKAGRVQVSFHKDAGFAKTKNNASAFELGLETMTFGGAEHRFCSNSDTWDDHCYEYNGSRYRVVGLPFEMRLSVNADDLSKVNLKDLRAGAVRFLFEDAGITLQIASFVAKKYPGKFGKFIGGEIVDFTVKGAAPVAKKGKIAMVVKADISVAVGETIGGDQVEMQQLAMANSGRSEGVKSRWAGTWRFPLNGSVGLRFYDKLLVELYGGEEVNLNFSDGGESVKQVLENYDAYKIETILNNETTSHLFQGYVGTGLRFQWKGLVVSGRIQRDYYHQIYDYNATLDTMKYVRATETTEAYSKKLSTENFNGKYNNSDRGYSGSFSVGFDW